MSASSDIYHFRKSQRVAHLPSYSSQGIITIKPRQSLTWMFVSRVSMEDKPSGKMKGVWWRPAESFCPAGYVTLSQPDGGFWNTCLSQLSLDVWEAKELLSGGQRDIWISSQLISLTQTLFILLHFCRHILYFSSHQRWFYPTNKMLLCGRV